jgi:4-amino-4-deoxy-L-arabinose transferase-like glycosyltransferase
MINQSFNRWLRPAFLALIVGTGFFLRLPPHAFVSSAALHVLAPLHPQPGFTRVGFDEGLYRNYVNALIHGGISSYPDVVDGYIALQQKLAGSILPPVRFLYIFSAYLWHLLFGSEASSALHDIASFFSMLTLSVATMFAWRLKGWEWALGVAALMAFAPTQIHMSQHALIDGFFTFWALLTIWLLWENLRAPHQPSLLIFYTICLTLMVLTKENSFFVFVAILTLLVANRWLGFGSVTREVLVCTFVGPLLGVVALVFLAGGIDTLVTVYRLSVSKNYTLPYAILTGDGPWYRYFVDLILVSPIIFLLAVGRVFQLERTQVSEWYLTLFVCASFGVMCNLKYGMNLRYANMWDMPLRFLTFSQVACFASYVRRYRVLFLAAAIAAICAYEWRQYVILFVQHPLYELVPEGLLRALQILKSP